MSFSNESLPSVGKREIILRNSFERFPIPYIEFFPVTRVAMALDPISYA